MKRLAVVLVAVLVLFAGRAFAAGRGDTSMDVFMGLGTEPTGGFGSGYGLGVGLNLDFNSVFNVRNPAGTRNLEIRADVSYHHWEEDMLWAGDLEYTRVPFFLGLRLFVPSGKLKSSRLGIYGEAGMELSFDSIDTGAPGFGASDDEVNLGFPIGGGIRYYVSPSTYVGFSLRIHLVSHSYTSLLGVIGFNL